MSSKTYPIFASCQIGFEEQVKHELLQTAYSFVNQTPFRATQHLNQETISSLVDQFQVKIKVGGVQAKLPLEMVYRFMLWSRVSARILLQLIETHCESDIDLYNAVYNYSWEDLLHNGFEFKVNFNGSSEQLKNTYYSSLRVKDGLVDHYTNAGKVRPNVNTDEPDILLDCRLHRNNLVISLDLTGTLHKRYRTRAGLAPMRETLAANLILRTSWDKQSPVYNPMCGSGVLAIEAALMALNIAPGLFCEQHHLDYWKGHDLELWFKQRDLAKQAKLTKEQIPANFKVYASDNDTSVLEIARQNAKLVGVQDYIEFEYGEFEKLQRKETNPTGLVIMNPPYGVRLANERELYALYYEIGAICQTLFPGWMLGVISASDKLLSCIALKASRKWKVKNSNLECQFVVYGIRQRIITDNPSALENPYKKSPKVSPQAKAQALDKPQAKMKLSFANGESLSSGLAKEPAAPGEPVGQEGSQDHQDSQSSSSSLVNPTVTETVVHEQQASFQDEQSLASQGEQDANSLENPYQAQPLVNVDEVLEEVQELEHLSPKNDFDLTNDPQAHEFYNRLIKNSKRLKSYLSRKHVSNYRLYDADIPVFNVAVDVYQNCKTGQTYYIVQEYAATKKIPFHKTIKRALQAVAMVERFAALDAKSNAHTRTTVGYSKSALKPIVINKIRERQKGTAQYNKIDSQGLEFLINEYDCKFLVNLSDYIDTGIFLDNRDLRYFLRTLTTPTTKFLNLFAYTATATAHVLFGGAEFTKSVDMSATYCNWAMTNLELNLQKNSVAKNHRVVQADVLKWLDYTVTEGIEKYDLVFCDPPTFSNSKRMEGTFDVQRDHVTLISQITKLLNPQGKIVFCNNKRGFKLDNDKVAALGLKVTDITTRTMPEDFAKSKIHQAWLLEKLD